RRVDREPPRGGDRRGAHGAEEVSLQRRGVGALPVPVARVLRLVPRDGQAVALSAGEPGPARAHPGDARARAGSDAPAPASVHAVHHPRDLPAPADQGRDDHARAVSVALEEGPQSGRRAADGGGHGSGHRRAQHPREMRIAPSAALTAIVRPGPGAAELFAANGALIDSLARVRLTVDPRATRPRSSALAVLGGSELYVELAGIVDPAAERQRIEKEITRVAERIEFAKAKLAKPDFAERAPAEIAAEERERPAEQEVVRAKLVASLGWFDDAGR